MTEPVRLYVVADATALGGNAALRDALARAAPALAGRPVAVYLREDDPAQAEAFAETLTRAEVPFLFTEAVFLGGARATPAGVHLRAGAPARASDLRRALPPSGLVARSVHSADEARAAAAEGCDFAVFGHVWETPSKPGLPGRGVGALREACAAAAPMPVLGIGGVTPARTHALREAGAAGAAVLRGVLGADDPATAVDAFLAAFPAAGR